MAPEKSGCSLIRIQTHTELIGLMFLIPSPCCRILVTYPFLRTDSWILGDWSQMRKKTKTILMPFHLYHLASTCMGVPYMDILQGGSLPVIFGAQKSHLLVYNFGHLYHLARIDGPTPMHCGLSRPRKQIANDPFTTWRMGSQVS